jgi:hypothetical protein
MATKIHKPRKTTRRGQGKLSASLFSPQWSYDGEMPTSAEADLRGMAHDTPFRVSGADYAAVQLDRTEN